MIITPKTIDLIESGTIYQGEFSTDRNYKGIFLEVERLNFNELFIFKSDEHGQITTKRITTAYDLANCYPTSENHLLKMMRAKFGNEIKRRTRASWASKFEKSSALDQRKEYLPQYSVK